MADHGTAFETRFKLMRERILAIKEIWTKSKPNSRTVRKSAQVSTPSATTRRRR